LCSCAASEQIMEPGGYCFFDGGGADPGQSYIDTGE